jgi:hypothetical protein
MALLAPQAIPVTGLTPSFAAASGGGDSCNPDDTVFLRVKNASGSSINVTIVTPQTLYGQAVPDVVVAVPATTGDVLIDLPASLADPSTGLVSWTYSAVTSVTVALIR